MSKQTALLDLYDKVLNLCIKLEEEMRGFFIESLTFIHISLPIIKYFSENNDISLSKIFSKDDISIIIVDKKYLKRLVSSLLILKNEDDYEKILKICQTIYEDLLIYVYENRKENLVSLLSDSFEGIDVEYIKTYFEQNSEGYFHKLLQHLQEEQETKNNISCITKESFLEEYPEFNTLIDKDGLINISKAGIEPGEYGVYFKDYFIYYSDNYEKLGFNKNFILEIVNFCIITIGTNTEVRVLLDLNKIISRNVYKKPILFGASYFGVDFKLEHFFTKSSKTLFTRKQRINKKFSDLYKNNIIYTDFYIDQINNSFLIEEISENLFDSYFINRLIHSEFNIDLKLIKHFDGSMLYYERDNLEARKSELLSNRPKLSKTKQKLFRIDGEIDFESYKNILLGFFIGNELVLEYFDFNEYKETYKDILDYDNGIDY